MKTDCRNCVFSDDEGDEWCSCYRGSINSDCFVPMGCLGISDEVWAGDEEVKLMLEYLLGFVPDGALYIFRESRL